MLAHEVRGHSGIPLRKQKQLYSRDSELTTKVTSRDKLRYNHSQTLFSKAIWRCRHLKMPWPGALGPWEGGHHEDTTLHLAASDIPERGLLLGG